MQKPRFKTTEKAAWVFIHTRLHPMAVPTVNRRTATRSGYLATAARLTGRNEKDLPLPNCGEPMSKYLARVKAQPASQG